MLIRCQIAWLKAIDYTKMKQLIQYKYWTTENAFLSINISKFVYPFNIYHIINIRDESAHILKHDKILS